MKDEVTDELIVQTAGRIADRDGLENLSLKEVAEKLEIRSPSLIFHVKSLKGLKNLLGKYTTRLLVAELMEAGFGKSGFDAITALGDVAAKFAFAHPGMYESIQWMNIYYVSADEEEPDYFEFQQITDLFFRLFEGSSLKKVEVSHIIRGFRCLLHGFATIAGHRGFGHPSDAAESFDYCLALYLAGVEQKLAEKRPLKDKGRSKLRHGARV
jgi:AcrR family transcriptional regulator